MDRHASGRKRLGPSLRLSISSRYHLQSNGIRTGRIVNTASTMAGAPRRTVGRSPVVEAPDHGTAEVEGAAGWQRQRDKVLFGSSFDSTVIESFWSGMQVELLDRQSWQTQSSSRTRSSSTSRSSTAASAATRRSACLPQLSSRLGTRQRQWPEIQLRDSAKPRAAQSLH